MHLFFVGVFSVFFVFGWSRSSVPLESLSENNSTISAVSPTKPGSEIIHESPVLTQVLPELDSHVATTRNIDAVTSNNMLQNKVQSDSEATFQSLEVAPNSQVLHEFAPLPTFIPPSPIPSSEPTKSSGNVSSKTLTFTGIGVGGAIISIFIAFTIFTKLKLRPSRRFKDREKSVDWGPASYFDHTDIYRGGYDRMS